MNDVCQQRSLSIPLLEGPKQKRWASYPEQNVTLRRTLQKSLRPCMSEGDSSVVGNISTSNWDEERGGRERGT